MQLKRLVSTWAHLCRVSGSRILTWMYVNCQSHECLADLDQYIRNGKIKQTYVYILNCSFLQVQCLHWWSQLSWFDQHLMQVMFLDFFRFWNWVLYRRVFKALSASQNKIKAAHCWILVVPIAWVYKGKSDVCTQTRPFHTLHH